MSNRGLSYHRFLSLSAFQLILSDLKTQQSSGDEENDQDGNDEIYRIMSKNND